MLWTCLQSVTGFVIAAMERELALHGGVFAVKEVVNLVMDGANRNCACAITLTVQSKREEQNAARAAVVEHSATCVRGPWEAWCSGHGFVWHCN